MSQIRVTEDVHRRLRFFVASKEKVTMSQVATQAIAEFLERNTQSKAPVNLDKLLYQEYVSGWEDRRNKYLEFALEQSTQSHEEVKKCFGDAPLSYLEWDKAYKQLTLLQEKIESLEESAKVLDKNSEDGCAGWSVWLDADRLRREKKEVETLLFI